MKRFTLNYANIIFNLLGLLNNNQAHLRSKYSTINKTNHRYKYSSHLCKEKNARNNRTCIKGAHKYIYIIFFYNGKQSLTALTTT